MAATARAGCDLTIAVWNTTLSQKTQKSARAQATNPQNLGMIQIYVLCYYYAAAVLSCDTSPREHACVNLISALMVTWAWLKSAIFSTM